MTQRLVLDMVHDNPGEPPFQTSFRDPAKLAEYGYNGQVLKHVNCAVLPGNAQEKAWMERLARGLDESIAKAKAAGLAVYCHIDLFVLPKSLAESRGGQICDPNTGRIVLGSPAIFEIHRCLFHEICARFPDIDGFIVRVGETYLFDTPFHTGNSPIPDSSEPWTPTYLYERSLAEGRAPLDAWTPAQTESYRRLISFLRDEICAVHGKRLIFRTWDIFPDRLHAVREHYLAVTDGIEPHPLLSFSIKHTALDFWRRVKVNECLMAGRHPQIVEVQCAREYEGKGAYPDYVMRGVFEGFEENRVRGSLREILKHPLVQGVYGWSRGGGWYGPYLANEFWCDLNAFVLGRASGGMDEEAAFREFCGRQRLSPEASRQLRELCLLSAEAVLKGRYCEAFDKALHESVLPSALWMRDDRLGGLDQLQLVFGYLNRHGLMGRALEEKAESVRIWERICRLADRIEMPDARMREHLTVSCQYGRLLYSIVHEGWRIMAGQQGDPDRYDDLWEQYRRLRRSPECASLYRGVYFSLPGHPEPSGMDESVRKMRKVPVGAAAI